MEIYSIIVYSLIAGWAIFSIYYIIRVWVKNNVERVIPYVYDSIPSVFTTLGILGTFVGIYFGLRKFDVNNITDSIPTLLEGLKTAFSTSIWGVSLSLIFGKVSQVVLRMVELKEPPKATGELAALQQMINILADTQQENRKNLTQLNKALIGEGDDSVSMQLVKLRNQFTEISRGQSVQNETLTKVQKALGGDEETSLLTQIQKLRAEQNEYSNQTKNNIDWIVESMNKNNILIQHKFDEFSELLAKNNTEMLVEVMKSATEKFNAQMSALIEKLVQENFKELNNSVQRMNQWQAENKEMIAKLTAEFKSVSQDFKISSDAIKEITFNTGKLTNDNSHLVKLIEELQNVMIEDTKFQEIIEKVNISIDTLKENTEAFDETTNKLNYWVRHQMNFSDSVAKLLVRLEDIDKIKDINDMFWNNTKKQLTEGVSLIARASEELSDELDEINEAFYTRLSDTFINLDTLIQRIIENYRK